MNRLAVAAALLVVGTAAVFGVGAFALSRSGSEGDLLLLRIDGDLDEVDNQYFLVSPGEAPGPDNQLDVGDSFWPAESSIWLSPTENAVIGQTQRTGFTRNGKYLIGVDRSGEDRVVLVIDTSSGDRTEAFRTNEGVRAVVAGNGAVLELGGDGPDEYLILDPSSSDEPVSIGPADEVRYSDDGRFAAFIVDATVRVVEIPSGRTIVSSGYSELAFAPDGEHVAVASEHGVEMYGLPGGEVVAADPTFGTKRVSLFWNEGNALSVGETDREAVMMTTAGDVNVLGPFEASFFVSLGSQDLLLLDEDNYSEFPIAYYSASDDEIVPFEDLSVSAWNGMPTFLLVKSSSSQGFAGVVDAGPRGDMVNYLIPGGYREVVPSMPGYGLDEALRVGDTSYFLFSSWEEDSTGDEVSSFPTGGIELYAERDGVVTNVFSATDSEVRLVVSGSQLSLVRSELYGSAVALFLVSPEGAQEVADGGMVGGALVVDGKFFFTRVDDEPTVMMGEVGGNAEPYAVGYRLVAAYIE